MHKEKKKIVWESGLSSIWPVTAVNTAEPLSVQFHRLIQFFQDTRGALRIAGVQDSRVCNTIFFFLHRVFNTFYMVHTILKTFELNICLGKFFDPSKSLKSEQVLKILKFVI